MKSNRCRRHTCMMKLLTTRPSLGCIRGPKVLKIRATRTSRPDWVSYAYLRGYADWEEKLILAVLIAAIQFNEYQRINSMNVSDSTNGETVSSSENKIYLHHSLRDTLALVVTRTRTDRVHVAPICLLLGGLLGVSIHFRS